MTGPAVGSLQVRSAGPRGTIGLASAARLTTPRSAPPPIVPSALEAASGHHSFSNEKLCDPCYFGTVDRQGGDEEVRDDNG